MATTRRYVQLAGTAFHEEAARLEERLGLSTQLSTHLSESERTSGEPNPVAKPDRRSDHHAREM
jgi:hypothetical protein